MALEFTDEELDALADGLDDRLDSLRNVVIFSPTGRENVTRARAFTVRLLGRIKEEQEQRRQPHPDHCLCDEHFTGLSRAEAGAETAKRIKLFEYDRLTRHE